MEGAVLHMCDTWFAMGAAVANLSMPHVIYRKCSRTFTMLTQPNCARSYTQVARLINNGV